MAGQRSGAKRDPATQSWPGSKPAERAPRDRATHAKGHLSAITTHYFRAIPA